MFNVCILRTALDDFHLLCAVYKQKDMPENSSTCKRSPKLSWVRGEGGGGQAIYSCDSVPSITVCGPAAALGAETGGMFYKSEEQQQRHEATTHTSALRFPVPSLMHSLGSRKVQMLENMNGSLNEAFWESFRHCSRSMDVWIAPSHGNMERFGLGAEGESSPPHQDEAVLHHLPIYG